MELEDAFINGLIMTIVAKREQNLVKGQLHALDDMCDPKETDMEKGGKTLMER